MEIYLDSADLCEIRTVTERFPIDGVTTNPTILARSGAGNPVERLREIRKILGEKTLFVQLTAEGTEKCLAEADLLAGRLGRDNLVFKVPVKAENAAVIARLAQRFPVCATAVYTVPQAVLAAQAGATYIAPYVSHLDAMSQDGPAVAVRMQDALKAQGSDAKVLGASFRVCSQIERLTVGGVAAVTVTGAMLESLWVSSGSENEMAAFRKNWSAAYGDKSIGDYC